MSTATPSIPGNQGASTLNGPRTIVGADYEMSIYSTDQNAQDERPLVGLFLDYDDGTQGYVEFPPGAARAAADLRFALNARVGDPDILHLVWQVTSACVDRLGVEIPELTKEYYGGKRGTALIPGAVVEDIQSLLDTEFRVGHDHRLYRRRGFQFVSDGEAMLRHYTRTLIGRTCSANTVSQVVAYVYDIERFQPLPESPNSDMIVVRQGAIDWRSGETSFDSKHASLVQLPVAYDPSADCPAFHAWLTGTLPNIPAEFIFEMIGYALLADSPLQVCFILLGEGRNGKSIFLRVLRALVGDTNVAATSLHDLEEQRFALASLYGKLLNVNGDISARQLRSSSRFKQIVGDDYLPAEFKGKDQFHFQPFAKLFFSANAAPGSADASDAWYRRIIIVPFKQKFDAEIADRDLTHTLTSDDELSGILNHALAGLRRVMKRGYFDLPTEVKAANAQYRDQTDIVGSFIREALVVESNAATGKTTLYEAFSKWCKNEGMLTPPPRETFYTAVRGLEGITQTARRFEGIRTANAFDSDGTP